MNKITQFLSLFDETKFPNEGDKFIDNADYSWTWLVNAVKEQNISFGQANILFNDLNVLSNNAHIKMDEVIRLYSLIQTNANISKAASDAIKKYVIPNDATYSFTDIDGKNNIQNKVLLNGYGYTKAIDKKDRFVETNTPYKMIDTVSEPIVFSDGIYSRAANEEIIIPTAPFAPTSTDELLDDSVHGLVCQQSHNRGDIVVTGKNLVLNGDFKSNTTSWNIIGNPTINVINNSVELTGDGEGLTQDIKTIKGEVYILPNYFSGTGQIRVQDSQGSISILQSTKVLVFTARESTTTIYLRAVGNTKTTYKDIALFNKNNIKQAIKNTVDMFDIETDNSTTYTYDVGKVFKANSSVAGGSQGHFYLVVSSYPSRTASATYFDNTNSFLDLGTAENMSLKNPYFKNLDFVSRQDLIFIRKHKSSKAVGYHSIKGYKNFLDTEMSNYNVMNSYAADLALTYIGKGLWEDAEYEYILVGLTPRLNAGGGHLITNIQGCNQPYNKDNHSYYKYWYQNEAEKISNVYDAFNSEKVGSRGSLTSGLNAHPNNKFYDKFYIEGEGGLIFLPIYAVYENKNELLESESKKIMNETSNIDSNIATYRATNNKANTRLNGYDALYYDHSANTGNNCAYLSTTMNGVEYWGIASNGIISPSNYPKGSKLLIYSNGLFMEFVYDGIDNSRWANTKRFSTFPSQTDVEDFFVLITAKHSQLTTEGNSLSFDLVGDIKEYFKDFEQSIVNNICAVTFSAKGQDAADYSTITNGKTFIASKKASDILGHYRKETNENISFKSDDVHNLVNNTEKMTYGDSYKWAIISYSSTNSPLIQTEPKKILKVLPKAFATNHHDLAALVYAATGKVSTSTGMESRVLENVILDKSNSIISIPEHNGFKNLPTSGTAAKFIFALVECEDGEKAIAAISQEGIPNASGYGWETGKDDEFEILTNGSKDDFYNAKVKTRFLIHRLGRY